MPGIPPEDVKAYWDTRSAAQGEQTVGPCNLPMSTQDKQYCERAAFIANELPPYTMALDYGCGIGRYSPLFRPGDYIGADICRGLLAYALARNISHTYHLLQQPTPAELYHGFDLFFTATVLQHNDAAGVRAIFAALPSIMQATATLALYENTSPLPGKDHVAFRQPDEYADFVAEYFEIGDRREVSHIVHGEEHTLMILRVTAKDNK